jgi:hypothetical protein
MSSCWRMCVGTPRLAEMSRGTVVQEVRLFQRAQVTANSWGARRSARPAQRSERKEGTSVRGMGVRSDCEYEYVCQCANPPGPKGARLCDAYVRFATPHHLVRPTSCKLVPHRDGSERARNAEASQRRSSKEWRERRRQQVRTTKSIFEINAPTSVATSSSEEGEILSWRTINVSIFEINATLTIARTVCKQRLRSDRVANGNSTICR